MLVFSHHDRLVCAVRSIDRTDLLFEFQLNTEHGFDPLLAGGDEREKILARGLTCVDDKSGMFLL